MDITRQDEQAARLREAREKAGFDTAKAAARRHGFNYTTYSQHERGLVGITRAAAAYARAFRVSEGWLLTGDGPEHERFIPIVGLAGAGPEGTVLYAVGDQNFGEVPAPPNSSEHTVALEVRGDSMRGMANDGWIITYEERGSPSDEHMGEPCVCWLEDERVLVKTPYRGRGVGLFDLESENAPTMRDVRVRYLALVTSIVPRRSAEKFIRRNHQLEIADVKIIPVPKG